VVLDVTVDPLGVMDDDNDVCKDDVGVLVSVEDGGALHGVVSVRVEF